eukprot:3692577-Prymnesium_polylepis.1
MPNAPETREQAHTSLSRLQRGSQERLMPQLEHLPTTTAAVQLTTAHVGTRAAVGTYFGNQAATPAATAAAFVRQSGLTVSTLVSLKRAAPGRTWTSAAHDSNAPR